MMNAGKRIINKRFTGYWIAVVIFLISAACYGKVFWGWDSLADSSRTLENLGGKIAYRTKINLNGAKGDLTVFHFNRSIPDIMKELGRIFNSGNFRFQGGTMATASIIYGDSLLRFVFTQAGEENNTIVFKIQQDKNDIAESGKLPREQLMKPLPPFPGSTPVFFGEDENGRMSLAVSETKSASAGVLTYYNTTLAGSGWSPFNTGSGIDHNAIMNIFIRGPELACVFVGPSNNGDVSRITLLYKKQIVR